MSHIPGKAAHILCDTCKTAKVGTLTKLPESAAGPMSPDRTE